MTTQEAYDTIRRYFNTPEAELAKTLDGMCAYRTETGAACAVGCLIPDEAYTEEMEGQAINPRWFGNHPTVAANLEGVDKGFLRAAQVLHDQVAGDARALVSGLDLLAVLYGLECSGGLICDPLVAPLV